jgi:hypothetical protein
MTRVVLLFAVLLCCGTPVAMGQTPVTKPPVEPEPGSQATIKVTEKPVANNLQQVTTKYEWTRSTGIKEVKVQILGKDKGGKFTVVLGEETVATTDEDGKATNKLFPDKAQPAKTPVKVKVTSFDQNRKEIKSDTSEEIVLP